MLGGNRYCLWLMLFLCLLDFHRQLGLLRIHRSGDGHRSRKRDDKWGRAHRRPGWVC